LLKRAALNRKDLLQLELEIRLGELEDKWHFSSLEKIFIENRIYRRIEEATTWEEVMSEIWAGLKPFLKLLKRKVVDDDIARLTEIKIKRISKYNSFKADELITGIEGEIEEVKGNLAQLTRYAIRYFKELLKKLRVKKPSLTAALIFGAWTHNNYNVHPNWGNVDNRRNKFSY